MKKGQVVVFTLMLAVVLIVLAIAFAPTLIEMTNQARGDNNLTTSAEYGGDIETTGLNCTGTNDSYVQAACVITDSYTPYFVGFLIALGGAVIGARIAFGS